MHPVLFWHQGAEQFWQGPRDSCQEALGHVAKVASVGRELHGFHSKFQAKTPVWNIYRGQAWLLTTAHAAFTRAFDACMLRTMSATRKPPSPLPQVDIFSREFFMEDCAEFVGQWMQDARLQELNNRQTCNEVTLLSL